MKGYNIFKGIFKTGEKEYDYEIHYKYFIDNGKNVLYKRVMQVSTGEDPGQKAEMLKRSGFDVKVSEKDIYLKCNKEEKQKSGLKISNNKVLNPMAKYFFFVWGIKFVVSLPEIMFF